MNEPKSPAEQSGTPDPGAKLAEATRITDHLASLLDRIAPDPEIRGLSLHLLIMIELIKDAKDFDGYLANIDAAALALKVHAKNKREAIEAAIAARAR